MEICTERVKDLLPASAGMCIPTFTVKKKINPPWITGDILNEIKKKKRLWRKLKACPSQALSRKFKELRRSVKICYEDFNTNNIYSICPVNLR